jgi:hypothetical protein
VIRQEQTVDLRSLEENVGKGGFEHFGFRRREGMKKDWGTEV